MKNQGSHLKRVNVLGVGINAVSLDDAVYTISDWIDTRQRNYVNVCTVHTVMECQHLPELRSLVNNGGMATPDGMPLVWLARYYGQKHVTRVYGPDLMLAVCEASIAKGYRHYFYGGAQGISHKLAENLAARFPNLQVAGAYSPPFLPAGAIEDRSVIDAINHTNPDIVWVGLGTPKQDYWVAKHRHLLRAPVLIAVGAAFDFHTGRLPQAPTWMQRSGLEWLYRLQKEPRRLAHRYLFFNPLFVAGVILQLCGLKQYKF